LADLTVEALDPTQPPVFRGGANAWQFSRCPRLTLRRLRAEGQSGNGFNLDDGGRLTEPVAGVRLLGLEVEDIGPRGNCDGIKVSGLVDLEIRDCRIRGWSGQGIDFVGCHRAKIVGCRLEGKPGFDGTAGIQLKGGTSDVLVENNVLLQAGQRPLNVGGSTGKPYFRPPEAPHEAKAIVVRGNEIRGGLCAVAFVGVDGAEFSGNRVFHPAKWLFRILQESRDPSFVPCRNVVVRDNAFVFRRAEVQVDVNIGPGTAPETFRFSGNTWRAEDAPALSRPRLPTAESDPRP
jgi:hypothetical protein